MNFWLIQRAKTKNPVVVEGIDHINTDCNAPGCPCEIVNEDSRSVLVQTDWDYPGFASNFGWSLNRVQKCKECGKIIEIDSEEEENECECGCKIEICDHCGDGTVDCHCGVGAGNFISSAYDFLINNDGKEAEDPGYFS